MLGRAIQQSVEDPNPKRNITKFHPHTNTNARIRKSLPICLVPVCLATILHGNSVVRPLVEALCNCSLYELQWFVPLHRDLLFLCHMVEAGLWLKVAYGHVSLWHMWLNDGSPHVVVVSVRRTFEGPLTRVREHFFGFELLWRIQNLLHPVADRVLGLEHHTWLAKAGVEKDAEQTFMPMISKKEHSAGDQLAER